MTDRQGSNCGGFCKKLGCERVTVPPKCKWVGLNVEEREKLRDAYGDNVAGLISAAQMMLKVKNNG